ncbi:MAG: hypothetical protein ACR2KE_06795 [Candidatus Nanopelagicales bacterium]
MKFTRSTALATAACSSAMALILVGGVPAATAAPAPVTPHPRTECPTIPWKPLEVAHEIIDISPVQEDPKNAVNTYKGGGSNEISDDAWTDYVPPDGWTKNSTRNLQFQMSQFIASPGAPICDTVYATTSDGYTWGSMSSAINAMWPYNDRTTYPAPSNLGPYFAGNFTLTPNPGDVKLTANYKAQNMEFWATDTDEPDGEKIMRYYVIDQLGNKYIAHATSADSAQALDDSFTSAVLPEGWKKEKGFLKEDFIIRPAEGSDGSFYYLVLRDSADIGYHQITWSKKGQLEALVPDMPIWGGQENDVLWGYMGKAKSERNIIHGAAGNDRIIPGARSYELWGDAGTDTVVLPKKSTKFTVTDSTGDGTMVEVTVKVGKKSLAYSLNYVETVKVGDKVYKTKNL